MKTAWFIIRNPRLCWKMFRLTYEFKTLELKIVRVKAENARLRKQVEVLRGCKQ